MKNQWEFSLSSGRFLFLILSKMAMKIRFLTEFRHAPLPTGDRFLGSLWAPETVDKRGTYVCPRSQTRRFFSDLKYE